MRNSDSDYDWLDDVGRALARFIFNVAAMVPMIAAAAVVAIFIHSLFSEPFGFTCKSVAVNPPAVKKRKAAPAREILVTPATEKEEPLVKILPDKDE